MRKAKFTLLTIALTLWLAMPAFAGVLGNNCLNAIPISCSNEVIEVMEDNSTADPSTDGCEIEFATQATWFVYTPGTDADVFVSTCSPNVFGFDTKISVFEGTCGALICLGGSDDFPLCVYNSTSSVFQWDASAGTTYYIAVSGFNGATGTFELNMNCQDANNDFCSSAASIECGETVSGSTVGSTFDAVGTCGTSNTAPGVWYKFTGVNGTATLSTCNQASYDTKISVFTGSCGTPSCVGGNDDGSGCSGFSSRVTVPTSAGTEYYVLVHGFGSATGSFDLTLTCDEEVGNDICPGAEPIACGETVSGSTAGASPDGAPTCGTTNTAPGVWYEFTPTENGVATATTCSESTDYDTKLSVFEGTCEGFSCVDGNDDDCSIDGLLSTVTWEVTAGTSYLILVHGFLSSAGDYELSITCGTTEAPENDLPCDATELTIGVSESFDNTYATADDGEVSPGPGTGESSCNSQDGWCSFETVVDNSVWFYFEAPASGAVYIEVESDDDHQLAVYTNSLCFDYGSYTEIGGNDDSGEGFSPALELRCLTPGETYYVQVDGYDGDEGPGDITVTDLGGSVLSCDAGGCQSKFIGYEPAEGLNHLIVTPSGGLPPYTISWSGPDIVTNPNTAHISVNPSSTATYTATVTDASGCTTECSVEVNVIDVRCGHRGDKIALCHVPPSDPDNPQELCIGYEAVAAHLNAGHGGDILGYCGNTCLATNPPPAACVELKVEILTDRFGEEISWELRDEFTAQLIASGGEDELTSDETLYTVYEDCVPAGCYSFTIFDEFGDGICCGFGAGTYFVSYDGVTTESPSGGDYGDSEELLVGEGCADRVAQDPFQPNLVPDQARVANSNVSVYPNPFRSSAVLNVKPSLDGNAVVDILDLTGRVLYTAFNGDVVKGQSVNVTLSGETIGTPGVYMYRVTIGEETFVDKFVYTR